jgi:hypothetical protein
MAWWGSSARHEFYRSSFAMHGNFRGVYSTSSENLYAGTQGISMPGPQRTEKSNSVGNTQNVLAILYSVRNLKIASVFSFLKNRAKNRKFTCLMGANSACHGNTLQQCTAELSHITQNNSYRNRYPSVVCYRVLVWSMMLFGFTSHPPSTISLELKHGRGPLATLLLPQPLRACSQRKSVRRPTCRILLEHALLILTQPNRARINRLLRLSPAHPYTYAP